MFLNSKKIPSLNGLIYYTPAMVGGGLNELYCSHGLIISFLWFQILHIVGSPTDEFSFCLNLFYASSFDVKAHPQFQHKWAIVRPQDKKWTFTQDLTNVVQTDTGKLIKNSEVEWFNLPNAMAVISTEIRPVLVLPHLFCLDGSTKSRYI